MIASIQEEGGYKMLGTFLKMKCGINITHWFVLKTCNKLYYIIVVIFILVLLWYYSLCLNLD